MIHGELVAYEEQHHDGGWRWIGLSMNLHGALLLARDWNRGRPGDCPACEAEFAQIFTVPYSEFEDTRDRDVLVVAENTIATNVGSMATVFAAAATSETKAQSPEAGTNSADTAHKAGSNG